MQSTDVQTVENNVQDNKTTRRKVNASDVINDSTRSECPCVTTYGRDQEIHLVLMTMQQLVHSVRQGCAAMNNANGGHEILIM